MKNSFAQLGFLLILLVFTMSSCKTKQFTFDNYDGNVMAIGSGGGFTGASSKYYLFENGQLFKSNRAGESPQELGRLDEKVTKQQFANYYNLGFDQLQLNDSGNMTYFIIMHPNTENQHMIKWGGGTTPPSDKLEQYYKLLSALIKQQNKPTM